MNEEKESFLIREWKIKYFTTYPGAFSGFYAFVLFNIRIMSAVSAGFFGIAGLWVLASGLLTNAPTNAELVTNNLKGFIVFASLGYVCRRFERHLNEKKIKAMTEERLKQFHSKHGEHL
jgi:hypothetical protein